MTDAQPMPGDGPVEVTVSQDQPAWQDYLASRDGATVFHDPRWGLVMEEAYGNRPYYLTARRNDAIVGILQLVHQKSLLFGTHLCSLPYFDASGILADDEEAAAALIEAARALLKRPGAQWVELRQYDRLQGDLSCRTDKITLRLALPESSEALWDGFKTKIRTQVRRAKKEGATIDRGGQELVQTFYDVYSRLMREFGSPGQSRSFFERILDRFPDESRVYVLRQDPQAVGAAFTIADGRTVYLPWSAGDPRYRDLRATMWVYWVMLEDACDRGAKYFDFGRSTRGSGTHRFKEKWGAEEVPLHWHYLLAPGADVPDLRPDSRKYRLAVAAWRKMPLWLARLAGPRIISKLS